MEIAANSSTRIAARTIIAAAAALLAFEPTVWLIGTWRDPSYDSQGFLVFVICFGLFVWSFSSPRSVADDARTRHAILILLATALIRLVSQVFAINTIGGLALVADVYAIGLLANLRQRQRPLSPGWLAVCFAFCLPLERIVQRSIGYLLQFLSADGACTVLQSLFDNVVCHGVRIILQGRDVLVDLPCSGAQALLLLLLFFSVTAALARPKIRQAFVGLGLTFAVAFAANVGRITLLAAGIAFYPAEFSIDVMAQPWHDLIGLTILGLAAMPVIVWARSLDRAEIMSTQHERPRPRHDLRPTFFKAISEMAPLSPARRFVSPLTGALAFMAVSLVIIVLPRQPLDVAMSDVSITLPERIDGRLATPTALSATERAYFTQYGGAAAKADYGSASLLLVRTSSPLRHLHAPDECLRGLGFRVDYLGQNHTLTPSAVYRATSPEGHAYRINVSFVSGSGQTTTNIAHAVWLWLQQPGTVWTAIQRVTPWDMDETERDRFERGVIAALDLPVGDRVDEHIVEIAKLYATGDQQ
jgi:exosortase/archaeosortase family protein